MKRPLMGLGIALAAGVAAGWSGVSWMIFCVMWIMTGDLRINNRKRYLFEYAQTETVTLIKYDGWTVRLFILVMLRTRAEGCLVSFLSGLW